MTTWRRFLRRSLGGITWRWATALLSFLCAGALLAAMYVACQPDDVGTVWERSSLALAALLLLGFNVRACAWTRPPRRYFVHIASAVALFVLGQVATEMMATCQMEPAPASLSAAEAAALHAPLNQQGRLPDGSVVTLTAVSFGKIHR